MGKKRNQSENPSNTSGSEKKLETTNRPDDMGNGENKGNRKNNRLKRIILTDIAALCIVVVAVWLIFLRPDSDPGRSNNGNVNNGGKNTNDTSPTLIPTPTMTPEEIEQQKKAEEEKKREEQIAGVLEKADSLATVYDYDGAIKEIQSFGDDYGKYEELTSAVADYNAAKDKLDPFGAYDSPAQISHIFFHSLVADTAKAFDGDGDANGYNYYMTTVSEFNEMMQQMYDEGYVLVSIHDVARQVKGEDGKNKFVEGNIMLPPDKKPFVLSQDDVNYYNYMTGDGFASRIIIDENGRPSSEMIMDDGTVKTGDFDMIPVLETFLEKHPDFSYKGARGLIALTGYEGTLGYRTNDPDSPTYEEDKETVKQVVKGLKEYGWEFGSHSYGHRDMYTYDYEFVKNDTDRWLEEVGSLIGPTDVFVFPYGIDIETSMNLYSSDKYKYLKKKGFDYFCGVYKDPWIQINNDYVRMTRRPLDGQAMLQFPERLADLFDLSKVIDPSRPELKR